MNNILSPELLQLLEGLKPYLGSDGKSLAESISKIINIMSSQPVREAVQEISNVIPQLSEKIVKPLAGRFTKPVSKKSAKPAAKEGEDVFSAAPVKASPTLDLQNFLGNNFSLVLFLILILLFFGDGGW